jgi:hypothetical protein
MGRGRGRGLGCIGLHEKIFERTGRRPTRPHRRLRISTSVSLCKSTSRRGAVGWVVSYGSTCRILSSVSANTTLPRRTTRRRDDQLAATVVQVSDETRALLSKGYWVDEMRWQEMERGARGAMRSSA